MNKRHSFGKIEDICDMPHLVEIQTKSFADFLQVGVPKSKRKNSGLEEVFREAFPIESYDTTHKLEYVSYNVGKPKYTIEECRKKSMTYCAPLKITVCLKSVKETKEQEIYMGDLPLMTENGTFIVNGDERVIVSQLHRSPGVSYEKELHPNGKMLYSARIIPHRGVWLEFEFDINDILYAYIDRKKKILATTLLRTFGYKSDEDIIRAFCGIDRIESINRYNPKNLIGHDLAQDILDPETQALVAEKGMPLTRELIAKMSAAGIRSIVITRTQVPEIVTTLKKDHTKSVEEAYVDIYRKLRPGDPPTVESAKNMVERMFFDAKRYDLGAVGRFVLNRKLGLKTNLEARTLNGETMVAVIKRLLAVKNGDMDTDDIDHLGNRRVRTVSELLQAQFRIGLARLERSAKERMGIYEIENMMPHNLINSKLVSSVLRDFFGRSQLSQFMDQTNPLAEMTHKRRLSALGPGGLSRERAGFEVRDVHHSHYGRICPIETPEGPNIGLIASLSAHARVNDYGFIETPYRKVDNGRVTNKIVYLSADLEDQYTIAQANAKLDKNSAFADSRVACRCRGDFPIKSSKEIDFMDVSPRQLVSVAAGLIPFLEHDDANRALMGSNMQRQAVPLLVTEAPLVGTGMENKIARDSGALVIAKDEGKVTSIQADEIVVSGHCYSLRKFKRSNASTCINQRPVVELGDKVKANQVIADGAATKNGELALGRNVLVAFMPWRGYNFEDAILLSEKLVQEDVYTSIHIEEFEIESRDTRLGKEEITRDIPNVGEEALKDLAEDGIIRVGAEVGPGDILVGKVTPKSETELSPEEKLLRAIFGEKAGDVRDASLTVPPGVEGVVIETKVFSRKGQEAKSKEAKTKDLKAIEAIKELYGSQIDQLEKDRLQKLMNHLSGKTLAANLQDSETGATLMARGRTIRKTDINKLKKADIEGIKLEGDDEAEESVRRLCRLMDDQIDELRYEEDREIDKIKRGDELPPGVLKRVKVLVAHKRKISVGDKMAGRHGNKGIIAKIMRQEDMPFLEDGSPVEIVLNPLGVPSRMNVGQILETHLGWAAKVLGIQISTPVFDGASETEIKQEMKKAGVPESGKVVLRDGRTGARFDQEVTVGYIYMMKLAHLVDDKIHARAIGPYSLVTQQPLGGKAQFGGQRFGEMEVWALEAYGAAYTLQELLTVKSDDVQGRTRMYESIVKGENTLQADTPESFNVLLKEIQSLALDIRTERKTEKEKEEVPGE
ncbi:MAG: DNA-directed RNA polymerase subunit beta [Omnitrophica bacterium RIFCSPHIGHO2_02_FULL_51_18]|nr:MAG: DNA-directed RNA polymerase subunit beta [Omnitrophica bacterium RIFCSPHIGHO2_02_FULL_51_18]